MQPELIRKLPETLQTNDALFLLVLFREDGYLGTDFRPLMKKEDDEINQTLYAYIASALCACLLYTSYACRAIRGFPKGVSCP